MKQNKQIQQMVPISEGTVTEMLFIRLPVSMMRHIAAIGGSTGNSKSTTARYLLAWALERYDEQHEGDGGKP